MNISIYIYHKMINNSNCICLKNKNSIIQCTNKRKNNSEYCGIHIKSKIKYRYDDYLNNSNKVVKIIDTDMDDNDCYTNIDIRTETNINKYKLKKLRNTLLFHKIKFSYRSKKKVLYELLNNFFKLIHTNSVNKDKIILIQRWFRAIIFIKRIKCKNEYDFYTNESKFNTSLNNIFIIKDISNHYYWFNTETFGNLIDKSDNDVKNPYSCNKIDIYYIDKFKLRHSNIKFEISYNDLSSEQKFRDKILTIFQKFNMLDNYTDFKWFENLSIHQLKKMYAVCEDIWNYRAELTIDVKKNIVFNGTIFTIPPYLISNKPNNDVSKRYIQDILLNEFDRLCSEGITDDDKKLGTMLALTALVEVSNEAANAMPQYVQGANAY